MELVIVFVAGILLGFGVTFLILKDKPIGTLRIDSSDPDGPYMFLELESGVGDICTKTHVLLKVDTKSYISQK